MDRGGYARGATPEFNMNVVKIATDELALTNYVCIAPGQLDPARDKYLILDDEYVFTARTDPSMQHGQLGTNAMHRRWAQFSLGQMVSVKPYDIYAGGVDIYLSTLKVEIGFLRKTSMVSDEFDTEKMAVEFSERFHDQIFTVGQLVVFEYHGTNFACTISDVEVVELDTLKRTAKGEAPGLHDHDTSHAKRGKLMHQTSIEFVKSSGSTMRLKGAKKSSKAKAIIRADFNFEDLGVGGLDDEFKAIFRRAFASRIFPPSVVEKFGVQHVKGLLLYGPPGTGKTLMARQIGKMLNAIEPKIVSGPEVLSKFVGQSEENVRKLFADAEAEFKAKGEDSNLHIIIFDELDAVCKQRGARGDSTGVGDSVVNQLLAKMDGVEQLNNILIIGMTNRKDMIDDALLRPGRFEVHMEVGLPDEGGRLQILKIHTKTIRENNSLDTDVSLEELAELTKNYSGAEIAGVIRAATSYAFAGHIKVGTAAEVTNTEDMKVSRDHFLAALDEVPPAFGVSEQELQNCLKSGIIPFSPHIEDILSDGKLYVEQVKNFEATPIVSVLLHGSTGSGKTALAASIAMESEFPFIKLISPENLAGMTETAKIAEITKVFSDAHKSPRSVIVLDDILGLLDWNPIGPRFSNNVVQTIRFSIKKEPPKGRRLLVLATAKDRRVLEQLDLYDDFSFTKYVPTVTSLESVDIVLKETGHFSDADRQRVIGFLREGSMDEKLSVGVKTLIKYIGMASQETDKVEKFVHQLMSM